MEDLSKYEYLIIVNYYDYDIEWVNKLRLPYRVYYKNKPEKAPFNAHNKAKSESNILKFCYDFYNLLPQNVIFVHQYEYKWFHEGSIVDILNNPNLLHKFKASKTPGYFNLNNDKMAAIEPQIWKMKNSGWWSHTMEPFFGKIEDCHNFTEGKCSAAQFIVSSDRIKSLPRYFYSNMYNWFLHNEFGKPGERNPLTNSRKLSKVDNHILSSYHLSRYLEWTYELIFCTYKDKENLWYPLYLSNIEDSLLKIKLDKLETPEETPLETDIYLRALYGRDRYIVNVSALTIENFLIFNSIIIHPDISFNKIYMDYLYGVDKILYLFIKKNNQVFKFEIPENRKNVFMLDVLKLD